MRSSAYFRRSAMAAASRFSGPTAWVLLDEFASIGECRNATTATGRTSAGRTVHVSFEPVDAAGLTRWFVHCPGLKAGRCFNGRPQILNASDSLILLRMALLSGQGHLVDYFVYSSGPGKPSLDLIPGPYPDVDIPSQIGIIPCGNGGYSVVFPVPQFRPRTRYEIFVFSSANRAWTCKVASISNDRETTFGALVMHAPTKAIAAGESTLAWIDLWRGVLLCNVLDEDPVLRLIQWPVLPPRDVFIDISSPLATRDATLSNGVIRFVELKFHDDPDDKDSEDATEYGWTATVWKRKPSSMNWEICFEADTSNISTTDSIYSYLRQKMWDDGANKLELNKMASASPSLSLHNEDVLYVIASLNSGNSEAFLLAIDGRKGQLEAVEQISLRPTRSPRTFSRFTITSPGDLGFSML